MSLTTTLLLIFIPNALFLLIHGLTRPWWKTFESSAMIVSSAGWSFVAGGFLLDMYVAEVPDAAWVAIGAIGAAAGWLKLWILHQARRERRASR